MSSLVACLSASSCSAQLSKSSYPPMLWPRIAAPNPAVAKLGSPNSGSNGSSAQVLITLESAWGVLSPGKVAFHSPTPKPDARVRRTVIPRARAGVLDLDLSPVFIILLLVLLDVSVCFWREVDRCELAYAGGGSPHVDRQLRHSRCQD